MKRKRKLVAVWSVVLIGIGVGLAAVIQTYQMADRRERIESRYEGVLALIERRASDPTLDACNNDDHLGAGLGRFDREQALYGEIAEALPSRAVYWATWSSDGHHGMQSLYSHEGHEGYTTFPWPVSHSQDGLRTLRRGRSVEGDALLVLEGRVPDGRKRVYRIAFYAESIRQGRENEVKAGSQPAGGAYVSPAAGDPSAHP